MSYEDDAREFLRADAELRTRMPRAYTRIAPDPELAARNQEFVRTRLRQDSPLYAAAVDSVVAADMPLEQAVRDLRNARNRVRTARNARTSRSAR